MKATAKGFGRPSKTSPDVRSRTGRLDLRADDEADACILCAIYHGIYTHKFPALRKAITKAALSLLNATP
jgi:hypothetical protein